MRILKIKIILGKIFYLIIIVISIQKSTAQSPVYGIKGGTNFSTILTDFESPLEYKYKAGFQVGVFANFKITDKLFFQPELLYSLQGTKYDFSPTGIIQPQDLIIQFKELRNLARNSDI